MQFREPTMPETAGHQDVHLQLPSGAGSDFYDDGNLRVEHETYYAACNGRPLKLTRSEFLILSRLIRNVGRAVTSAELWKHIWGDSKPVNHESLHVCVYRLRSKLAPYAVEIETMVGVGYRLFPAKVEDQGE